MKKSLILAALVLGSTQIATAQAAGDAAAGEPLTAACGACHGADGNSAVPNFPKLAGLGEKYLFKQLKDIRDG
ncbi:c-type cytochrome, partial [Mangrovimicrobium sediminis]